ncbi:Uncharacterised protein [Mycobacteroides abscessus subsp. abscessus]|nr:Uncharacterised protein [Mycobacteroides abscessus subsp. abscessus]
MVVSIPAMDAGRPSVCLIVGSNGGIIVMGSRRLAPTSMMPQVNQAVEVWFFFMAVFLRH